MQFMIIRKADAETEAGVMPSEALASAMMAYNQQLVDAGIMVGGDGLMPSSRGARITFEGGRPHVVDGPFAEAKELVAGYTLIEVPSREAALEWALKWPVEDGHGNVELEIRQIVTIDDLGDAFTPELREKDERMRQQIAQQQA